MKTIELAGCLINAETELAYEIGFSSSITGENKIYSNTSSFSAWVGKSIIVKFKEWDDDQYEFEFGGKPENERYADVTIPLWLWKKEAKQEITNQKT
ncbi:hypothetical protein ES703_32264 [subsurface metagenome]